MGREQRVAAEDVQGEVAIAIVEAVEEATFLFAVDWIVGGVEVEDDLFERFGMSTKELVDEK